MKKILFFAAFLMISGIVFAQSDAKSCDKPCTHSEKASVEETSTASKALMAANNDENIEVKTCEDSGKVSFYRKDVCEQSGKVSYTEVEYQEGNGQFAVKASNEENVNTAPAKASKSKSSCGSKSYHPAKKSCGSSSAAAKTDCSSKSASKSCCSSKATKASLTPAKSNCCASPGKKSCSSKS
jgi:hypothetical protein